MRKFVFFTFLVFTVWACKKDDSNKIDSGQVLACFESAETSYVGEAVWFDGSCSKNATSYLWDFSGEGNSTESSPNFTFASSGVKTIKLIVSSGELKDTVENTIEIISNCIEHNSYSKIDSDVTWKSGEVHCITGYLMIDGATLTIEPGVTINMGPASGITIGYNMDGSAIKAIGNKENPIIFTSVQNSPQPGDWEGIYFYDGASPTENILEHCIIKYGGCEVASANENLGMVELKSGGTATITNCTLSHSSTNALMTGISNGFVEFSNNTITDIAGYAIKTYVPAAHTIGTGNYIDNKGIYVEGGYIKEDVTWHKQTCPFIMNGGINIGSTAGSTWTIEPGVEIQFKENYGDIEIGHDDIYTPPNGAVKAIGTAAEPIMFTSRAEAPERGIWGGITFGEGTMAGTVLDHVIVKYASGNSTDNGSLTIFNGNVSITNSQILEGSGIGIYLESYFTNFSNNIISTHTSSAMKLNVDAYAKIGDNNSFTETEPINLTGSYVSGESIVWKNCGVPFIVNNTLYVGESGAAFITHLTIEPGCEFRFMSGAGMQIGGSVGKLTAIGTIDNPIIFTSTKEEASKAPGDWGTIGFSGGLVGTVMQYCEVSYGGGYGNIYVSHADAGEPLISDCKITNSETYGINIFMASPTLINNTYSNNLSGDVRNY